MILFTEKRLQDRAFNEIKNTKLSIDTLSPDEIIQKVVAIINMINK